MLELATIFSIDIAAYAIMNAITIISYCISINKKLRPGPQEKSVHTGINCFQGLACPIVFWQESPYHLLKKIC